MPRRPSPLPAPLVVGPFTVEQARALDVTRQRLRARDLRTPTRGLRTPLPSPTTVTGRAREVAAGLSGDFAFSHTTAARLHGLPTPARWTPDEPLDVMRATGTALVTRRGVRSHGGLERRGVVTAHDLPVTDPLDTWVDLAGTWSVGDLVALGDALLNAPVAARPKDLERLTDAPTRGVRRLREAVALVRPGAASAWESRARVAFVSWGVPEPELNVDVHADDGRWLARPDFVWRARRVVGEYDGDQHRTERRVWQYERERRARLEDDGWTYVELTSLSLAPPHSTALRLRLTRLLC